MGWGCPIIPYGYLWQGQAMGGGSFEFQVTDGGNQNWGLMLL